MTDKKKSLLTDAAFGLVVTIVVIFVNWDMGYSVPHLLSDGFFVAAVLLIGSGGMVFCRNKGAFDMIAFGVRSAVNVIPAFQIGPEGEGYYEFCQRKAEERKPKSHLFVVGLVYLALALVCVAVYSVTG